MSELEAGYYWVIQNEKWDWSVMKYDRFIKMFSACHTNNYINSNNLYKIGPRIQEPEDSDEWIDCPHAGCANQGFIVVTGKWDGEPEQAQCEFCYTNPKSRFNYNRRIPEPEDKDHE